VLSIGEVNLVAVVRVGCRCKKFTFAISSTDEFLVLQLCGRLKWVLQKMSKAVRTTLLLTLIRMVRRSGDNNILCGSHFTVPLPGALNAMDSALKTDFLSHQ